MSNYCYKTAIFAKNFYIRFQMGLKKGLLKRETYINLCCFYLNTLAHGLLLKSSSLTGRHLLHRLLILCDLYFAFLEVMLSHIAMI